jgi:ligand-binding sensor domain-containing protein
VFDGNKIAVKNSTENPIYPSISSLAKDNRNNIWISTEGGGFYQFDGKNFTQFSEKDGLPTSFITTIQPDLAGNVWLGTNKGLIK